MKCHTPDCTGEHEPREISHSVVYRERTYIIANVPAGVCPDCGAAGLAEETTAILDGLLRRKSRGQGISFAYEA